MSGVAISIAETVAGVSNSPTAASFVRPTRKHDQPRSFVDAVKHKYASEHPSARHRSSDSGPEAVRATSSRVDHPIKISGKVAEEVGFDKIRSRLADLHELRVVILDGLQVHRPLGELYRRILESWRPDDRLTNPLDSPTRDLDVARTCPLITELDLSRNLFEHWLEIASICEELPALRSLRCDGNRFSRVDVTETEARYFCTAFRQVRSLSLSETLLPWQELATIASNFTGLSLLTASANQLRRLGSSPLPQSITTLTLEHNNFASLSDISALQALPNLQKLNLRNNLISSITAPTGPSPSPAAPVFHARLRDVDLSHNAIADWSFIDALPASLPGLTSLRISGNPLFDGLTSPAGRPLTADDGYMLVVARLARLASLNHSAVSAKDRLNAETYYLSQITQEQELALRGGGGGGGSADAVLRRHPRWRQLCDEYGEPVVAGASGSSSSAGAAQDVHALATRLLRLRLRVGESAGALLAAGGGGGEEVAVSVPKRYSVYAVQGVVGRRLGLAPPRVKLVWETAEPDPAAAQEGSSLDAWDSDADDDGEDDAMRREGGGGNVAMREVELVPGTRPISTWVDGDDVVLRVEIT